jgi:SAM-dependent methyltransferase
MADSGEVTRCVSCFSRTLVPVLDMGMQPLAERMGSTRTYPLRLVRCVNCSLVQLSYIVPQEEMFPEDHPFVTGNSAGNRVHFRDLARAMRNLISPGDLVVDIGCNDGTFLAELRMAAPGVRVAGVEPTGQGGKASGLGIHVFKDFFTCRTSQQIASELGPAAVVTASNVLAHVPDPHGFLAGVSGLLAPGGIFITENHDWESIECGLQIDAVYHEHLRYYSVSSLSFMLARNGLTVTRVQPTEQHGGSFRTFARPQPVRSLASRAEQVRGKLHDLVKQAAAEGSVYGVGAATRATSLIEYAGISPYLICVCEISTSDKVGLFMPGGQVPVVDEQVLITDQPEYALLLSWHLAGHIIPKLRDRGFRGKFIIPLPDPAITEE